MTMIMLLTYMTKKISNTSNNKIILKDYIIWLVIGQTYESVTGVLDVVNATCQCIEI